MLERRLRGGFGRKFELEKVAENWYRPTPFAATLNLKLKRRSERRRRGLVGGGLLAQNLDRPLSSRALTTR